MTKKRKKDETVLGKYLISLEEKSILKVRRIFLEQSLSSDFFPQPMASGFFHPLSLFLVLRQKI